VGDLDTTSVGWSKVADAYAETFAPLCAGTFEAVLAACGIRPGATSRPRVLDVGAGTGALAALAADAGAEVTAVDPDPEMLRLAARSAPDAELRKAGLPDLPFLDDAFDAVMANFVVNHLQDPRAGMRELVRVAAPGSPVAVTIWPSGQNVQSRLWAEVIGASGAVAPPSVRLPPEMDFPRTLDGLVDLVTGAGLRRVDARPLRWTHRADADSLWRGAAAGVGGIGKTVTSQTWQVRARMEAEYDRLVAPLLEDGRLRLDTEALIAVGTKASQTEGRR
jgi:SAM-dependent methyltransferase